MGCFRDYNDRNGGTQTVVLSFSREEIQYDIDNNAWIEGMTVEEAPTGNARQMVQDVGQSGNVDRVTRVLDVEMAKVREMLYPYTKHDIHHKELDNKLRAPGTYGVVMSVPETFSQTTLNLIEKLVHEYLVDKVLEDWLSITNPAKAEAWGLKAEEAKAEMKKCLNSRMGRLRRRLHPW